MGWLRAAVLGADDGLVSTASLILGVAAAGSSRSAILIAGLAGLVAGAMSMAAGEYVSVSSQADAEASDLKREAEELRTDPEAELAELAAIYAARGLSPDLARTVAAELMKADALGAHARDELGLTDLSRARPLQAAAASAFSFTVGAAGPLLLAAASPAQTLPWLVTAGALAGLAILGAAGAGAGGAAPLRATVRVVIWGGLALAATAGVGALFGVA
jgi:VIT1/CCC1 family predicted Fe2+/Mn2+ transporter